MARRTILPSVRCTSTWRTGQGSAWVQPWPSISRDVLIETITRSVARSPSWRPNRSTGSGPWSMRAVVAALKAVGILEVMKPGCSTRGVTTAAVDVARQITSKKKRRRLIGALAIQRGQPDVPPGAVRGSFWRGTSTQSEKRKSSDTFCLILFSHVLPRFAEDWQRRRTLLYLSRTRRFRYNASCLG